MRKALATTTAITALTLLAGCAAQMPQAPVAQSTNYGCGIAGKPCYPALVACEHVVDGVKVIDCRPGDDRLPVPQSTKYGCGAAGNPCGEVGWEPAGAVAQEQQAAASHARTLTVAMGGSRIQHHLSVSLDGVGPYDLILDTGADGCMLPLPIAKELADDGALVFDRDLVGVSRATLADGSMQKQPVFRVDVGLGVGAEGVGLKAVQCGVSMTADTGLLGMGFLAAFDSFAIDNGNNKLTLTWTI